jgi:hypothetical protein
MKSRIAGARIGLMLVPMGTTAERHGFFTLGGTLARWWRPAYSLLPWAFTSALLTVAAMWDHWSRGGPIDYAVLGLAAYELMMGLLEEPSGVPAAVMGDSAGTRRSVLRRRIPRPE